MCVCEAFRATFKTLFTCHFLVKPTHINEYHIKKIRLHLKDKKRGKQMLMHICAMYTDSDHHILIMGLRLLWMLCVCVSVFRIENH